MRRLKDYILLYVKGMSMGAAAVVPGVSGGSVAFISGIYGELIHSLSMVDREAIKLLFARRVVEFWERINGSFLTAVGAGLITSVLSLAKLMAYCLRHYPILILSFFFGVILLSAPLILRELKNWNLAMLLGFFVAAGVTYGLSVLSPIQTPETVWFVFFVGILVACGTLLPGISGLFVLLLLNKYQYILHGVMNLNVPVIALFLFGLTVGLFGSARFLSWSISKFPKTMTTVLAGLMIGALNKVWPWREVMEYATNRKGVRMPAFDKSILPWDYAAITGKDPQVFLAILMIALGVFIVVLVEKISVRLKTKS